MPRIFIAFDDHERAQRAVDELVDAGFARNDIALERADGNDRGGEHEGQGVLSSIGHAIASVAGMDSPDAQARPYLEGALRGGTVVTVDAIGDPERARARHLLRALGGHELAPAAASPAGTAEGGAAHADRDRLAAGESQRRRAVERALAADQAASGRAWSAEEPGPAAARERDPDRR